VTKDERNILDKLCENVGYIRGTVDQILEQQKEQNKRLDGHDEQIQALRNERLQAAGAAGVRGKLWARVWSVVERTVILILGILFGRWFNS